MTEKKQTGNEQAVRALYDFLRLFFNQNRIPWMHGVPRTEFDQGRDDALTGLALIPELRLALDAIDEEIASALGSELERFHEDFKSQRESESKESQ